MEPFEVLSAVAAPLEMANIDTDQIVPARFLSRARDQGFGEQLFHDLRFDETGAERADFVLNRPAYRAARILVTGRNFGCGSSRESAVWALLDYGVRALVSDGYGDIFYGNALQNGLLPVVLPQAAADELRATVAARAGAVVTVDLRRQSVEVGAARYGFEIDARQKDKLLTGADEITYSLAFLDQIERFEREYDHEFDWLASRGDDVQGRPT